MAWIPLDRGELRIGLYIKLDHKWTEHPFYRGTFKISSPSEIAIILKHQLTRIAYDPDRSNPDAVAAIESGQLSASVDMSDAGLAQAIEEDEQVLRKEKEAGIKAVQSYQEALKQTEGTYANSAKRYSVMTAMMNAGQPEGFESAIQMLEPMMSLLEVDVVAVSLVGTVQPTGPGQELAMQSLNASAIAFLVGRTMHLGPEDMSSLVKGALFHNIGQQQVSLSIRAKTEPLSTAELRAWQLYPKLGKEILESMSGVPSEIIEIVYQHQEYLDGSGYPRGLGKRDITVTKLSRIVGIVAKYFDLTSQRIAMAAMTPTQALSHIYAKMQCQFGLDVIEPLIASMTVYPPGSYVEMSDGSLGLVVKVNGLERMRPLVMLYEKGTARSEAAIVDLARDRTISIQKSLDPKTIDPYIVDYLSPSRASGYALTPLNVIT